MMQKVHFRLMSVTQKRCCLSSLLGNVKAGDLLGLGVQGHQFNVQSLMLFNLLGLHAIVSYIK